MLGVCSDLRKVCGVAQARVTSEPAVVGSIPTGSESCRSSVAEHWTVSDRLFPPQKYSGVVRARITSTQESTPMQIGEVAVSKPACLARGSSSSK